MSPTQDSDDELPTTTPMEVDKTETTVEANGDAGAEKKPKATVRPFFKMSADGASISTFLYHPTSLKHMAQMTLDEICAYDAYYSTNAQTFESFPSNLVMEVAKYYAKHKSEDKINGLIQDLNAKEGADLSLFKNLVFYQPKIPIDPDIDKVSLEKIASGKCNIHESLGNALANVKGESMDDEPYCCDKIHEIGASKMAKKSGQPVVCLAHMGPDDHVDDDAQEEKSEEQKKKTKVTMGQIDKVFGIDRPKKEEKDDSEAKKESKKRTVTGNRKTLDGCIEELQSIRSKSGYEWKVKMYNEAMAMSTEGPPDSTTLEDLLTDAWTREHDRDAEARRQRIENMTTDTDKAKKKKEMLQKKTEEKTQKLKEKLTEYVRVESEKIRKDVVEKHCTIKDSNIRKAAGLKMSRHPTIKKDDDKYQEELTKLMDEYRKDWKAKLLDPKTDKPKLEQIAKKQFYLGLRRKRLQKSQITCPVSLTKYTPLTDKCPVSGTVNITTAQRKIIDKTKRAVTDRYALHANKVTKKGFAIKIFI